MYVSLSTYRKSRFFHVKIIHVLIIHIDLFSWVCGTYKYFKMTIFQHEHLLSLYC